MYVQTSEGLGQIPQLISCIKRARQIDVDKAGRVNSRTARSLNWQAHRARIISKLGLTSSSDDRSLATAVATWQCLHDLPADGIIGRITWSQMRPLDVAPYPGVNSRLPTAGPGFHSYKPWPNQFGLPETIQALKAIGAAWRQAHPQGPRIGIGDISLRGGGPIRGHKSHQKGVDVDIRLVRNDGKETPVNIRGLKRFYSRPLTRELVRLILDNGVLKVKFTFFNDPELIKDPTLKRGGRQVVRYQRKHDDHLHVRFYPPTVAQRTATVPPPHKVSTAQSSTGFSFTSLFRRIQDLVRRGQETFAIGLAIFHGLRDENELTNMIFFARHPKRGRKPIQRHEKQLAREWLNIRNRLVRPAIEAVSAGRTPATSPTSAAPGNMPQGPFGTLVVNPERFGLPEGMHFSYTFTPEDVLWAARFIEGEAGGKPIIDKLGVLWAMFNRFGILTHRGSLYFPKGGHRTFTDLLRQYSTTLQPELKSSQAAERAMARKDFEPTGGFYPGTTIPKGQTRRHRRIQEMTWPELLRTGSGTIAEKAMKGLLDNPGIGNASEFASTWIIINHEHRKKYGKSRKPTDAEWIQRTKNYKRSRRFVWLGRVGNFKHKGNTYFDRAVRIPGDPSKRRIVDLPDGVVQIVPPRTNSSSAPSLPTEPSPKSEPVTPLPTAPSSRKGQAFDPATHPWEAAIQLFGGRVVDPAQFPNSQAGFQQYLNATGVQYFSAREMTTPHHPDIAKRLGYTIFLPKHEWWPQAAALAKLADRIRKLVNSPVKMRNWWRPRDYNKAVKGARDSDHITAKGIDLDYRSANDRRQAEAFLKKIRRKQPWLRMSLGLGNRATHVGLLTKRGERTWHYKSYRR